MQRRLALLLASASVVVTLSGCVAAVLPLAAAGVIARGQAARPVDTAQPTGEPQVTVLADEAETAMTAPSQPTTGEDAAEPVASAGDATVIGIPAAEADAIVEHMSGDVVLFDAPIPAPAAAAGDAPEDRSSAIAAALARVDAMLPPESADPAAAGPFSGFIAYSLAQSDRREAGQLPYTVMLDGPPLPDRERFLPCGFLPPAVIIDLDSGTGEGLNLATVDAAASLSAAPGLADGLQRLRQRDIAVIWISSLSFDRFDTLAAALRQAGLDPDGRDSLVLTRTTSERKQQRRADTASTHCVLAIAGDRKADFDELYDYLRFPELPVATDHMIGSGWFMTPQPLTLAEPVSPATPPLPALPQP